MTQAMTKGNPLRLLVSFMVPVLIGNLFQNLYSIVDSMIVGRYLGVNALASVGSVGIVIFGVQGLAIGLTSGFGVVLAQDYGGNREEDLRRHFAAAGFCSVVFACIVTVLLLWGLSGLLRFMNTPLELYGDTKRYTKIIFMGFLGMTAYNFLASTARALGDSRTPLYFLLLSSAMNVILDIIFIRDFHMGVEGAAVATVFSQAASAVLCFIYMFRKYSILRMSGKDIRFSEKDSLDLLRIGLPMALQFFVTSFGGMVLQSALNYLGAAAIAAFSTAQKICQLIQQPGVAVGTARATFVGQNLGAGEGERIREGVRQAIFFTIFLFAVMMLFCFFFGEYAGALFLAEPDEELQKLLRTYFHITTLAYIPLGLIFVYRNALQGLGDGVFPMLGGAFELLGRIAIALFIGTRLGFSGICLADPAAWLAALIPMIPVYYLRLRKLQSMEGN